jgi:8-oxo-dGTP pyrophosphatase MutT (NUDIX family)
MSKNGARKRPAGGPSKTRYVLGFALHRPLNYVVVIEKKRPAWQAGRPNGLGGHVQAGEDFAAAMAREFQEECGLAVAPARWKQFATMGGMDWTRACFTADLTKEELDALHTTTDEVVWVIWGDRAYPGGYDGWVLPNLKWLIPMAMSTEKTQADVVYL